MPLTRFNLSSTAVENTYGIVDLAANGLLVATDIQLNGTPTLYEYDIPTMTPGINTITVSLKNGFALDANGDGDYNDPDDQTMIVSLSNLAVANDNVTFVEYLPRAASQIYDATGNVVGNITALNDFVSFGPNYTHTFIVLG